MNIKRIGFLSPVVLVLMVGCPNNPTGGLSDEQREAVETTLKSVASITGAAMTSFPASDLETFGEIVGNDDAPCPTVNSTATEQQVSVTLDFGDACTSPLYPDQTFSGSITGTVQLLQRTATLLFEALTVDETMLDGTIEGGVTRVDSMFSQDVTIDLTVTGLAMIQGSYVVQVDSQTGVVSILTAVLSVTDANDQTLTVALDDVVIDPLNNENLIPESGIMLVTIPVADGPPDSLTLTVSFTETSPEDHTVFVSIAGTEPAPYTCCEGS